MRGQPLAGGAQGGSLDWFRNLSLKKKLVGGGLVGAALTLAVGLSGYWGLTTISTQIDKVLTAAEVAPILSQGYPALEAATQN
jgi:hypothetical protein